MNRPGGKPDRSAAAVHAETVEKLALAVAKRGSDALLIDEDNLSAGRLPIPEAARSGRCFAVELRNDMVGLDVDQNDAARWVINFLLGELVSRNIPTVVENSGTPGHLHLFAPVHDPKLKAEIEGAAHLFGCDVRAGQRIRPPLSPHRLGLSVGLVTPNMPAQALKALATIEKHERVRSDAKRRSPSGQIFEMLQDGDGDRRYPSRSEMIQAFADSAVNADLSEAWLLKVLLDEKNRGGEKIQELARKKGEREAQRYVAMVYGNAREFVPAHPPFGRRPDVLAKIDEIERRAVGDAERWKGRAGATDLAVLNAHLRIMRRCGSLEHGASVREVAILTGINSISTVSAAHGRLECDYLRCVARAKHGASARYLVGLSKFRSRTIVPIGGGVRGLFGRGNIGWCRCVSLARRTWESGLARVARAWRPHGRGALRAARLKAALRG
jgi:hypothetical protein